LGAIKVLISQSVLEGWVLLKYWYDSQCFHACSDNAVPSQPVY